MFLNEIELKVLYEMKREEMKMAILASQYKKHKKLEKSLPKKLNCCDINIHPVCCEY